MSIQRLEDAPYSIKCLLDCLDDEIQQAYQFLSETRGDDLTLSALEAEGFVRGLKYAKAMVEGSLGGYL